jgi:hypothetical protein
MRNPEGIKRGFPIKNDEESSFVTEVGLEHTTFVTIKIYEYSVTEISVH